MNAGTLMFAVAGTLAFIVGVYLSANGERSVGILLMAGGLIFQLLCLRQLRTARKKDLNDAGRHQQGDAR